MRALLLVAGLVSVVIADDAMVTVCAVEMEHAEVSSIIIESHDGDGRFARVRKLIDAGKATFYETLLLRVKLKAKAFVEGGAEMIYPTEFEYDKWDPKHRSLGLLSEEDPFLVQIPRWRPLQDVRQFETRTVGSSLEIHVEIDDEGIIIVKGASECLRKTRDVVWLERDPPGGEINRLSMPEFEKVELINTTIETLHGRWNLVGLTSVRDDGGGLDEQRMILVFLRCDLLELKGAER